MKEKKKWRTHSTIISRGILSRGTWTQFSFGVESQDGHRVQPGSFIKNRFCWLVNRVQVWEWEWRHRERNIEEKHSLKSSYTTNYSLLYYITYSSTYWKNNNLQEPVITLPHSDSFRQPAHNSSVYLSLSPILLSHRSTPLVVLAIPYIYTWHIPIETGFKGPQVLGRKFSKNPIRAPQWENNIFKIKSQKDYNLIVVSISTIPHKAQLWCRGFFFRFFLSVEKLLKIKSHFPDEPKSIILLQGKRYCDYLKYFTHLVHGWLTLEISHLGPPKLLCIDNHYRKYIVGALCDVSDLGNFGFFSDEVNLLLLLQWKFKLNWHNYSTAKK